MSAGGDYRADLLPLEEAVRGFGDQPGRAAEAASGGKREAEGVGGRVESGQGYAAGCASKKTLKPSHRPALHHLCGVYRVKGLTLRYKRRRRRCAATNRREPCKSTAPNQVWSLDFVADKSTDGRRFRALNAKEGRFNRSEWSETGRNPFRRKTSSGVAGRADQVFFCPKVAARVRPIKGWQREPHSSIRSRCYSSRLP